jgi:hypothetical protein
MKTPEEPSVDGSIVVPALRDALTIAKYGKEARHAVVRAFIQLKLIESRIDGWLAQIKELTLDREQAASNCSQLIALDKHELAHESDKLRVQFDSLIIRLAHAIADWQVVLEIAKNQYEAERASATPEALRDLNRVRLEPRESQKSLFLERLLDAAVEVRARRVIDFAKISNPKDRLDVEEDGWSPEEVVQARPFDYWDFHEVLQLPLSDPIFQNRISPRDVAESEGGQLQARRDAISLGIDLRRAERTLRNIPERYRGKNWARGYDGRAPRGEERKMILDEIASFKPAGDTHDAIYVANREDDWHGSREGERAGSCEMGYSGDDSPRQTHLDRAAFQNYCNKEDPPVEYDRFGIEIETHPVFWGPGGLKKKISGLRHKKGKHISS